jgi:hypothetical protein
VSRRQRAPGNDYPATVESLGRDGGSSYLLQSIRKAQKAPLITGAVILVVVALIAAAGVTTVLTRRHSGPNTAKPVRAAAPVSLPPYAPRPGPNGTKILTETIDPLSLAVPSDWMAPPADQQTLPGELDAFAAKAPALAAILHTEADYAHRAAVRIFAYQPVTPFTFVSVLSYASPSTKSLTAESVAAVVAASKKTKPTGAALSGVELPIGPALKTDSSMVSKKQTLVIELVTLVAGGRTTLVLMVSETNVPAIPQIFDQIARSLSRT